MGRLVAKLHLVMIAMRFGKFSGYLYVDLYFEFKTSNLSLIYYYRFP